jgi:hypothetical protein
MKTNTWLHMKWYVLNWNMKGDERIIVLGMIHNYDGIRIDMVRKSFCSDE